MNRAYLLGGLFLAGCSGNMNAPTQPPTPQPAIAKPTVPAPPTEKEIAEQAVKSFPAFAAAQLQWAKQHLEGREFDRPAVGRVPRSKFKFTISDDYRYDVKKTDSVISPLKGEIKFKWYTTTTFAEGIGKMNLDEKLQDTVLEASYRDNKWHPNTDLVGLIKPK